MNNNCSNLKKIIGIIVGVVGVVACAFGIVALVKAILNKREENKYFVECYPEDELENAEDPELIIDDEILDDSIEDLTEDIADDITAD